MDIDVNVRMHQAWLEKMPRVVPHYAIKCNDTEVVSATLATLGASFACATEGKILALVVSPDRIIIVNPMKPSLHLRYISANNVKTMTFDSEIELHKIRRFCPDAKLVLRIRCEAEKATCPLRKKFGCEFFGEVPSLIKIARIMNPDVISISFHVRSGCSDFPIYYKAIFIARDLFDYAKQLGYEFNLLDIGGVFPGSHRTSIDEDALIINTVLDKFFVDTLPPSLIGTTKLLTNVQSKHACFDPATGTIDRMICICIILFDNQYPQPRLIGQQTGKTYKSTIWGPSSNALDQVVETINLPELQIKDLTWVPTQSRLSAHSSAFHFPRCSAILARNTFTANLMINYENVVCA